MSFGIHSRALCCRESNASVKLVRVTVCLPSVPEKIKMTECCLRMVQKLQNIFSTADYDLCIKEMAKKWFQLSILSSSVAT